MGNLSLSRSFCSLVSGCGNLLFFLKFLSFVLNLFSNLAPNDCQSRSFVQLDSAYYQSGFKAHRLPKVVC